MRKLHDSGLFFYEEPNCVVANRVLGVVSNIKAYKINKKVINILGRKKFYFSDMDILIIELPSNEMRYFQYRKLKNQFIEVDESYVDESYYS